MFCCFSGDKKGPNTSNRQSELLSKRPQQLIKTSIPLSLSQNIKFNFGNKHKWQADSNQEGRTEKRPDTARVKARITQAQGKLAQLEKKIQQTQRAVQQKQKDLQKLQGECVRSQAYTRAMQCLIANEKLEIYKYQDIIRASD